jgi:Raf kinase inhibitor-like YbhB/YbcL family protein
MAFKLTVAGFREGETIPKEHTCEGKDISPALAWEGAPAGTQSYALIMDDPDAPVGTWNHWLVWNIPATTSSLPEGVRPGFTGVDGTNDFGKRGYGGPCPPRGHGAHRYYFRLYALDVADLKLRAGAKRAELDRALKGHILAEAQYMGRYERR